MNTSNELAMYHKSSVSSATYLTTREMLPTKKMNVDDDEEYDFDEAEEEEDMLEMKIVLVSEDELACASLRLPFCCGSLLL